MTTLVKVYEDEIKQICGIKAHHDVVALVPVGRPGRQLRHAAPPAGRDGHQLEHLRQPAPIQDHLTRERGDLVRDPGVYRAGMIATMPFGRTGHHSTRVIFGAAALGAMSQDRADATLRLVTEAGVNHIDTAASYGESELRLAPWLEDHRGDVFLATKTGERDGDAARAELERSLTRLGVDRVDLIQLHNLVEEDEWRTAFAPGASSRPWTAPATDGLVAHIGVTGHGLRIAAMHERSLDEFPFDSVLLPYSPVLQRDAGYRVDVERLLATCRARGVAIQTIKAVARRRWRSDDDSRHLSWYEPTA